MDSLTKEEAAQAYADWIKAGEVGLQRVLMQGAHRQLRWRTERNFYRESFPLDNRKFLASDPVSMADRDIQEHKKG